MSTNLQPHSTGRGALERELIGVLRREHDSLKTEKVMSLGIAGLSFGAASVIPEIWERPKSLRF